MPDTNSIDNLIDGASLFTKTGEVDSMSDFTTHHRTSRRAPNWLDSSTNNQIDILNEIIF